MRTILECRGIEVPVEAPRRVRLTFAGGHCLGHQQLENEIAAAILLSGAEAGKARSVPVAVAGLFLKLDPGFALNGTASERRQNAGKILF
ncbi:hypothetical protein [Sinorhizobium fredii]|uniref:hypothetical protein n=1 Tax=Rhizobium fredii TaxID=380 RepID=UPI001F0AB0AC|nr:hypothetical protein [Sinorhizobium fredii]